MARSSSGAPTRWATWCGRRTSISSARATMHAAPADPRSPVHFGPHSRRAAAEIGTRVGATLLRSPAGAGCPAGSVGSVIDWWLPGAGCAAAGA